MRVVNASRDRIIEPCSLEIFDYEVDPYTGCAHRCHYCYTQNLADIDWESEVGIFPDLEARLAGELSRLSPQTIYIGMNTDPYQPLERESKQTRRVLELLEERGFSSCILTKSDLVERDIDLLKRMPAASVGVSVSFQDETVRKHFEQNTIPTGDRLKALRKIKQAGIETYVLISPLMPLITDVEVLIQDVCDCAGTLWIYPLRVESRDDKNWRKIEQILSSYFPMIKERFEEIVFTFDHTYWQSVRERLKDLSTRTDVDLEIHV